jgi:hypothetical protein
MAFKAKKSDLVTYALIGAAATPIAIVGGEAAAAVFCIVACIIAGVSKRRV